MTSENGATPENETEPEINPPDPEGGLIRTAENRYLPPTWRERDQALGRTTRATPRVRNAQLRRRIIDLIVAGRTEQEVADELGIKRKRVSTIVTTVLSNWRTADIRQVEQLRTIQLARLDAAIRALMPKVEDGNLAAIDSLTKVEALRAKVAGTEKPVEHRHSHDVTHRLEERGAVENLERAWLDSVDGSAVEVKPEQIPETADVS